MQKEYNRRCLYYNRYIEYKNNISNKLSQCRGYIDEEITEVLNKISSMDSSKYSVDILEVQNLIDADYEFEFIWHNCEGECKLDKTQIGLKNLKQNIVEELTKEQNGKKELIDKIEKSIEEYPKINAYGVEEVREGIFKGTDDNVKNKLKSAIDDNIPQGRKGIFFREYIYFGTLFVMIFELDEAFYEKYIEKLSIKFEEFDEKDNTLLAQVIDVIFQKWLEHMYYEMGDSVAQVIMTSEATVELAARAMTEGRDLVPSAVYSYISSINYEGRACAGKIAFVNEEDILEAYIKFAEPFEFNVNEGLKIRKYLEMATDEYYLIVATEKGVGWVKGISKLKNRDQVDIVEFLGHMKWRAFYGEIEIMKYDNTHIKLPDIKYTEEYYNAKIREFFGQDEVIVDLGRIIEEAKKQKHGAMIIISKVAQKEVERLVKIGRGTKIESIDTTVYPDIINRICAIDGAIFIDLKGLCVGIGMIVDGQSSEKGNPARGSRYNSAKNYVASQNENNQHKCMAIVFSEDKTIDILQ